MSSPKHPGRILNRILRRLLSFCLLITWSIACTAQSGTVAYVTAPSGLILRKGPDTGSARLGKMPYGTSVRLTGAPEGKAILLDGELAAMQPLVWKSEQGTLRGYAFGGYLSLYPPDPLPVPVAGQHWDQADVIRWGYRPDEEEHDRWVREPDFVLATPFSGQRAAVIENGHGYLIDAEFRRVADLPACWPTYTTWEPSGEVFPQGFSYGRLLVSDHCDLVDMEAPVSGSARFGFVDRSGRLVIGMDFAYAEPFQNGLALVNQGGDSRDYRFEMAGHWMFIDTTGSTVIDLAEYDYAWGFSEGRSAVNKGDLWGFIGLKGEEILPVEYEAVSRFENGYAWAFRDGEGTLIDYTGQVILRGPYVQGLAVEGGEVAVVIQEANEEGTIEESCWMVDLKGNRLRKVDCQQYFGGC